MRRLAALPRQAFVAFLAIAAAIAVPVIAVAPSSTTTAITASPSPATKGQSVTFTATASAPGTVTFSFGGSVIGTATAIGGSAATPVAQRWNYTGNSVALASTTDATGNAFVTSYNPDDCSGARCVSRRLTPAGAVNYFPQDGGSGMNYFTTGIAVASNGTIYEAVLNRNAIYKRSAYNAAASTFVGTGLTNPCGLTMDADDNLYVSANYNPNAGAASNGAGSIRKITPAGVMTTYVSGLTNPCGMVMNKTTGVIYYTDNSGDIYSVPSGGGSSSRLVDGTCNSAWWGSSQLAIDELGYLYGRNCNGQAVTQISPTGTMRTYFSTAACSATALDPGACGGTGIPISYYDGSIFLSSANMYGSSTYRFGISGFVATLDYTPPDPGSFAMGASLAPADGSAFSGSSGSGTLLVRPVAPQTPDLAAASDTGASSTDDRTNDNTPRIEVPGTYATGNTITVTATKSGSTNVTCTYVIPATGCDLGTLADGVWSITATDTHPTGGASAASTALSITVDTAAPSAPTAVDLATASDSGTSTTDNVTSDNTPTMSASGGAAGETMTLTATKSGAANVSCSYVLPATNCTMGTMEDGTWAVRATLTDAAGNVSAQSTALNVTVDTTGPGALTPDLVAASDLGSSNSDNVTSDNTPTITIPGQASGDVITITAARSGFTSVTCTYTVGGTTTCTLGTLADGEWSVTASVADLAGNSGTTLALGITVDTSAPTAPTGVDLAASSDLGTSSTDNLTSDTTPTVSASGGSAGETMSLTASRSGQTSVTCSYVLPATSCDLGTLSDGVWAVSATRTDPAGNTSAASSPLNITVDTSAPTAPTGVDLAASSDLGTSSTDNLTSDTTPTVSASGGSAGETMSLTASRSGQTSVTCSYVLPATSCDLGTLADGVWAVSATLTDQAGNTSAASSPLSITVDTSAPITPTLPDLVTASDTGASTTDNVTSDTTPAISAAGVSAPDRVTVTASNGFTSVSCSYTVGVATSCDLPALTDGIWNICTTATDAAGNTSGASPPLGITIDTTPPAAPSLPDLVAASDTGASSTDNSTSDNTPAIAATGASDGDRVTVSATRGATTVTCTYTVGVATSCDLPLLADGTWSITTTATDPAGNTSPASPALSIVVSTAAPTAPSAPDLLAASDTGATSTDNITSDSTPAVAAPGVTSGMLVTLTATRTGQPDVSCTYTAGLQSSCDLTTLAQGTWSVTATVTNDVGLTSAASAPLSILVQLTPPGTPAAPDLAASSDTGVSTADNVTNDNTPLINLPGITNGDTITISATKNGTTVTCSYVAGPSSIGCSLGTLADGTWSITAVQTDLAGNASPASPPLSVAIDTTAPSTPSAPDLLPASDSGSSNTDNATTDNTPEISIPGVTPGDTVTVSATDGTTTVTCTYVAGTTSSCSLPAMADGTWTVTATATDPAGNTSPASSPLSITIDTTPPGTPNMPDLVVTSDLGSSTVDNLTSDTTPAITAPGIATGDLVTVTATKGSTTVTCTFTAGLVTSCDLPALSDGTWIVTATATDPAGLISPASAPLSLVIDSAPPSGPGAPSIAPASDTGSSNSDGVTSDTTPEIVVPGATTGDTITVSATQGGTTVTCTFVAAPGVNGCTLPALGPGEWSIVASSDAVDAAGNTAPPSSPAGITIDTSNAAPGVPDLTPASDTGPSSTDDVTKDTQPVIDVPGVEPGSIVTVVASQPGRPDVTCTFVASAAVTGCALPFLADGTWSIVASSVDPAGNPSPPSSPLSIFLDTAPPPPPPTPVVPTGADIPALGPVKDLGGDDRPIVGVDGGTPGDVITVIATDGTRIITCSFMVGQATSCRLPALPPGTWTITATATDPAGNASRPSGSISVRVTAKAVATSRGRPVLKLTGVTSRPVLRPRDRAVITLRARNPGKVTARNVVMRVTVPKGLAVVGQRALATGDARITFRMASLAPGTTASRQVTVVALSNGVGKAPVVKARLSATSATARLVSLVHRVTAPSGAARGSGDGATRGTPVTG